jgi:endogenous inhibitor of DNA gyrase (YacG/DUF329 family)
MAQCPICRNAAAPRSQNKSAPFCSPRCKLVDLGKWLDGKYAVPTSEEPESEDRLPTQEDA